MKLVWTMEFRSEASSAMMGYIYNGRVSEKRGLEVV